MPKAWKILFWVRVWAFHLFTQKPVEDRILEQKGSKETEFDIYCLAKFSKRIRRHQFYIIKPCYCQLDRLVLPTRCSGSKFPGCLSCRLWLETQAPAGSFTWASVMLRNAFLLPNSNTWEYHKSKLVVLVSINLIASFNCFALTRRWELTVEGRR